MQGGIGASVPATVEASALGLAGGGLDRADAAQRGEGRFGAQPVGVVTSGDEQVGAGVRADAVAVEQRRGMRGDRFGQVGVEIVDFGGEVLDAARQQPQCVQDRAVDIAGLVATEMGAATDQQRDTQPRQRLPQRGGSPDQDCLELVDRLRAGLDRRALGQLEQGVSDGLCMKISLS
jgi:hypothetical protein